MEPGHNLFFSSSLMFLMSFSYSWFNFEQFIVWERIKENDNKKNAYIQNQEVMRKEDLVNLILIGHFEGKREEFSKPPTWQACENGWRNGSLSEGEKLLRATRDGKLWRAMSALEVLTLRTNRRHLVKTEKENSVYNQITMQNHLYFIRQKQR